LPVDESGFTGIFARNNGGGSSPTVIPRPLVFASNL
jgi:hypothetical protein